MVNKGRSYCNLQEKVGIEDQKFLSRKLCKTGRYLQLLSIAMLEMYRTVYLTVFFVSGQQLKTEQICTYVCVHVCTFVCMHVRMYVYHTVAGDRMAETKPFLCVSLLSLFFLALASNKHGKVKVLQTLGGSEARVFFRSLSLSLFLLFFLSFFGKQQAREGQGFANTRRLGGACFVLFSFFVFFCFFLALASNKHRKVEVLHTPGGLEVRSGAAPARGRVCHLLYMRHRCVSILHGCRGAGHHMRVPAQRRGSHCDAVIPGRRPGNVPASAFDIFL